MSTDRRLQFGEFALDRRNACVWRGMEALKLKPKAFDVLHYLVEHAGQLVSKDDLWRAIWPDVAVTDGVLAVCLTEIRQALGDDAKAPRFIETMHRRGYRFIAVVTQRSDEPVFQFEQPADASPLLPLFSSPATEDRPESLSLASLTTTETETAQEEHPPHSLPPNRNALPSPSVSHPLWSAGRLLMVGLVFLVGTIVAVQYLSLPAPTPQSLPPNPLSLPLPDKPSIIVLPLVNLSNDPEQDYFSDGLTEVLTGDLSQISSLFVIARNSAFTYKGKAVKVQDVSKEMGVKYVLEGSVQKTNQQIRINAQLIDATTGYHLWSEQYDRPFKDIFALQDEIVQKIVTTLKLQLTLLEQGILVRKHTNNVEAYDTLLRGVEYYWRITKEANAQARQLYEQAVALDPQYAEAYACLAETYYMEWVWRWSADPQTLERALALAQRALALNDLLPSAHAILGIVYAERQQHDQAIGEGERAIALAPNNASIYVGQAHLLILAGRPEEALRAAEQAIRLNPRSPPSYLYELGWAYRWTGRYTEAITTLQEYSSRNPNAAAPHLDLAVSYLLQWLAQQNPAGQTLELALAAVQRALSFNDSLHWNHNDE